MVFLSAALATLAAFATSGAVVINRAPVRVVRDGRTLMTAPDRRVRAVAHDMQALIARGMAKSTTFSRLMIDIDNTDVIVYVEFNNELPQAVAGRLVFGVSPAQGPRCHCGSRSLPAAHSTSRSPCSRTSCSTSSKSPSRPTSVMCGASRASTIASGPTKL